MRVATCDSDPTVSFRAPSRSKIRAINIRRIGWDAGLVAWLTPPAAAASSNVGTVIAAAAVAASTNVGTVIAAAAAVAASTNVGNVIAAASVTGLGASGDSHGSDGSDGHQHRCGLAHPPQHLAAPFFASGVIARPEATLVAPCPAIASGSGHRMRASSAPSYLMLYHIDCRYASRCIVSGQRHEVHGRKGMTQERHNERLWRAWDAQGEGHVLPRRPPKDRED
jgi:hypothetical protein